VDGVDSYDPRKSDMLTAAVTKVQRVNEKRACLLQRLSLETQWGFFTSIEGSCFALTLVM
jgi:hypothetical protein